ncbi:MAG: AtpZ/AtpI family protein [Polyangia bacterium]
MWRTASRFSYVGIFFGVAVVVGYLFGHWVEQRWGYAPWPSLAGVVFGVTTGFRELYRIAKLAQKDAR